MDGQFFQHRHRLRALARHPKACGIGQGQPAVLRPLLIGQGQIAALLLAHVIEIIGTDRRLAAGKTGSEGFTDAVAARQKRPDHQQQAACFEKVILKILFHGPIPSPNGRNYDDLSLMKD
jgi:hypothetical protein